MSRCQTCGGIDAHYKGCLAVAVSDLEDENSALRARLSTPPEAAPRAQFPDALVTIYLAGGGEMVTREQAILDAIYRASRPSSEPPRFRVTDLTLAGLAAEAREGRGEWGLSALSISHLSLDLADARRALGSRGCREGGAVSDPFFAEVLADCHTIESAKDAWVRFGAPEWRDLTTRLAAAEATVEALRGVWHEIDGIAGTLDRSASALHNGGGTGHEEVRLREAAERLRQLANRECGCPDEDSEAWDRGERCDYHKGTP